MLFLVQSGHSSFRRILSRPEYSTGAQSGFTAIEFLIALSAVAVLLVGLIAGASQRNERWLVNESARNLQLSLAFARNQAISRRSSVRICPASDLPECSEKADWNAGWMVFDAETQEILRLIEPVPGEIQLFADSGVSLYVQFNIRGDAYGTAGEFVFCHQSQKDYTVGLQVLAVGLVEHVDESKHSCSSMGQEKFFKPTKPG